MKNTKLSGLLLLISFILLTASLALTEGSRSTSLKVVKDLSISRDKGYGKGQGSALSLMVRNTGKVKAKTIFVSIDFPDGSSKILSGPKSLDWGKTGTYTAKVDKIVASADEVKIVLTCDNCD